MLSTLFIYLIFIIVTFTYIPHVKSNNLKVVHDNTILNVNNPYYESFALLDEDVSLKQQEVQGTTCSCKYVVNINLFEQIRTLQITASCHSTPDYQNFGFEGGKQCQCKVGYSNTYVVAVDCANKNASNGMKTLNWKLPSNGTDDDNAKEVCESMETYSDTTNSAQCKANDGKYGCGNGCKQIDKTEVINYNLAGKFGIYNKECMKESIYEPCQTNKPCDCKLKYGDWSSCSTTCGKGSKTQIIEMISAPTNGGQCAINTSPVTITEICGEDVPCPVNCLVADEYGPWSDCSATCGDGIQISERTIITQPSGGGLSCPQNLTLEKACNVQPCPVKCEYSSWTPSNIEDAPCSVSCGNGTKIKTRSLLTKNEKCEDSLIEKMPCYNQQCNVDCVLDSSVTWSECSTSCGVGIQTYTPKILTNFEGNGKQCNLTTLQRPCKLIECPIDCVASEEKLTVVQKCNAEPCTTGEEILKKEIIINANHGGQKCEDLLVTKTCKGSKLSLGLCDENGCYIGEWKNDSQCSASCGIGVMTRSRIVEGIRSDGTSCGKTTEEIPCENYNADCAVDCSWHWEEKWSDCSTSCGVGTQTDKKIIDLYPEYGGEGCGDTVRTRKCYKACPPNCIATKFSDFSACSVTCGTGTKIQQRDCYCDDVKSDACWNSTFLATNEESCNMKACQKLDIPCEYSDWKITGECSTSCGYDGLLKKEKYLKNKGSITKSNTCENTVTEYFECNRYPCPIDCQYSLWSDPTTCSTTCGKGVATMTREIEVQSKHGGQPCNESLSMEVKCEITACPINCKYSDEWEKVDGCSEVCGGGRQKLKRKLLIPASNGGVCEEENEKYEACNTHSCPTDCQVGDWTEFGPCDKSCGGGFQIRTRPLIEGTNGGKLCPKGENNITDIIPCNEHDCSVDCELSPYGSWSKCSASCGGGLRVRSRQVLTKARGDGADCEPQLTEIEECNVLPCPIDCQYTEWKAGACSVSCGHGTSIYTRQIVNTSQHGGKECGQLTMQMPCDLCPCPVNCEMSEWKNWTLCDKPCGGGQQHRFRYIKVHPQNGGNSCSEDFCETRECNMHECSKDCEYSSWSNWTDCTKSCGTGEQTRKRTILNKSIGNGVQCKESSLIETRECNTRSCPVDCVISKYSPWSQCSASCDTGYQFQKSKILVNESNGGLLCPSLIKYKECNTQPCVKHCQLSDWTTWSACSTTCGPGIKRRRRDILQYPQGDGAITCGNIEEVESCANRPCPINCEVSAWSKWTSCNNRCGHGIMKSRYRHITRAPKFGGQECPHRIEHLPCDTRDCPSTCPFSNWGDFSVCNGNCNSIGVQSRIRIVDNWNELSPTCHDMVEQRHCEKYCPIQSTTCETTEWSEWSDCNAKCGSGQRVRYRKLLHQGEFNGSECSNNDLAQYENCNSSTVCSSSMHTSVESNVQTNGMKSIIGLAHTLQNQLKLRQKVLKDKIKHKTIKDHNEYDTISMKKSHNYEHNKHQFNLKKHHHKSKSHKKKIKDEHFELKKIEKVANMKSSKKSRLRILKRKMKKIDNQKSLMP